MWFSVLVGERFEIMVQGNNGIGTANDAVVNNKKGKKQFFSPHIVSLLQISNISIVS